MAIRVNNFDLQGVYCNGKECNRIFYNDTLIWHSESPGFYDIDDNLLKRLSVSGEDALSTDCSNIVELITQYESIEGNPKIAKIILPEGTIQFGRSDITDSEAFRIPETVSKIVLSRSIQTIESYGFYYYKGELILKEGLKNIKSNGIYQCELLNLELPDSLEMIYPKGVSNSTIKNTLKLPNNDNLQKNNIIPKDTGWGPSEGLFYYTDLKTIIFPPKMKTIGRCFFYSISKRNYPYTVTLDLIIPNTIEEIEEYAFYSSCLKSLFFEDGSKELILNERCFYGLESTSNYNSETRKYTHEGLFSLVIPSRIKIIPDRAFFRNSSSGAIKELEFKNGVREIHSQAFGYQTLLNKITFSNTIKSIDDNAFYSLGYNIHENGDDDIRINLVFPPSLERVGKHAFYVDNNNIIGDITILDGELKEILEPFISYGAYSMTGTLTISSTLERIGKTGNEFPGVFGSQRNAKNLIIPVNNSLRFIAYESFYEFADNNTEQYRNMSREELIALNRPQLKLSNLEYLGYAAFQRCCCFGELILEGEEFLLNEDYIFFDCLLTSLTILGNLIINGRTIFQGNRINSLDFQHFTKIPSSCFANNCFENLDIPDNCVIEDYAFYGNSTLKRIHLGENVTFGTAAFSSSGCNLEEINYPEDLIDFYGFENNNMTPVLEAIINRPNITGTTLGQIFVKKELIDGIVEDICTIPEKIHRILSALPANITILNFEGFIENIPEHFCSPYRETSRTQNLIKQVYFKNGISTIPEYAFCNCSKLEKIYGLNKTTSIGNYAFYRNNFSGSVKYPRLNLGDVTLLETVGKYAFYNVIGDITRLDSLKYIDEYGFYYFRGTFLGAFNNEITAKNNAFQSFESDFSVTPIIDMTSDYSPFFANLISAGERCFERAFTETTYEKEYFADLSKLKNIPTNCFTHSGLSGVRFSPDLVSIGAFAFSTNAAFVPGQYQGRLGRKNGHRVVIPSGVISVDNTSFNYIEGIFYYGPLQPYNNWGAYYLNPDWD